MNIAGYLIRDPDRPEQVTYAVFMLHVFLVVSFVIYLVQTAVSLVAQSYRIPISAFALSFILTTAIYLVMYFVATKVAAGRNWARWLLLGGFIILVVISNWNMQLLIFGNAALGLLILIQMLVTAVAVALLFQQPCNTWFAHNKFYSGTHLE